VATAPFVCQKCGAALAIPPNPMAVSARCGYCNTETMLPAHVLAARQPPPPQVYGPPGMGGLPPPGMQPFQPIQPITAMTPLTANDGGRRMKLLVWIIVLTTVLPLIFAGVIMWFVSSTISHVIPHR
jgi:hypothetical protein